MKHTLVIIGVLIISILIHPLSFMNQASPTYGNHPITKYTFTEQYLQDWSIKNNSINPSYQNICTAIEPDHTKNSNVGIRSSETKNGSMDSPWPMLSYDIRHSGRSPLSTANNPGTEIWRFQCEERGQVYGSAVIDNNSNLYFPSTQSGELYALYPNGTKKWSYYADGSLWCTSALAHDGTIYFTTWGGSGYFYAITKNGTEQWRFYQESSSASSPTIGTDGIIYFGTDGHKIFAVNPNGTKKWDYLTGDIVMGSPAISDDGTIYIGSMDRYLYALYPNGTLRWRFATGSDIKGSASIATDDTIYVPSFDGYLYALYPNGTMKWRVSTGDSVAAAGVALVEDGTIYVGTEQLRAFYPNGTLKWITNVQGSIYSTVPAVSADGTIYVSAGGSLVAVNPDGTERWRKQLTIAQIHSSPSIGPDDRVYVGSETYELIPLGFLHAFGLGPLRAEAYGPYNGAMTEPLQFTGEAFGGTPPYTSYHWDFGDGITSNEPKPTHIYAHRGNYTAIFTVTDNQGNHSQDTAQVTIGYPLPKISIVKPQNAVYFFNIKILPWPYPLVFGRILFQVEASQIEIGIDRVEFYYDGNLMLTDEISPYQWLYTGHAPPLHQTILVRVYDSEGNSNSTSKTINKWF